MSSDLISREFLQTAIHNFFNGLNHTPTEEDIQRYIEVAPSVDIMECARALKKWCEKRQNREDCKKCPFHSTDPMWICSVSHCLPEAWDLPEGEKGGNDDNT